MSKPIINFEGRKLFLIRPNEKKCVFMENPTLPYSDEQRYLFECEIVLFLFSVVFFFFSKILEINITSVMPESVQN